MLTKQPEYILIKSEYLLDDNLVVTDEQVKSLTTKMRRKFEQQIWLKSLDSISWTNLTSPLESNHNSSK